MRVYHLRRLLDLIPDSNLEIKLIGSPFDYDTSTCDSAILLIENPTIGDDHTLLLGGIDESELQSLDAKERPRDDERLESGRLEIIGILRSDGNISGR